MGFSIDISTQDGVDPITASSGRVGTPAAAVGTSGGAAGTGFPLSNDTPSAVAEGGSAGTANSSSRSDHTHDHGDQTSPTDHALATPSAHGFLSQTDKALIDTATEAPTALALMRRDGTGQVRVADAADGDNDQTAANTKFVNRQIDLHQVETDAHEASVIGIEHSTNATYTTLQKLLDITQSPGLISGGQITVASATQVSVAAGVGLVRALDDDVSTLKVAVWPTTLLTIPNDNTTRHIGVQAAADANGLEVVLKTTFDWDKDTAFPLGSAVQINSIIFPFTNPYRVGDPNTNIIQRFDAMAPAMRDNDVGGLILSDVGTRNIQVTAGKVWFRLNDKDFPGLNTSVSGGFGTTYYNGTSWTYSAGLTVTQWPNTVWNNTATGTLDAITGNRYVNHWFYLGIDGAVILMLYGQNQWVNISDALSEGPPSLTPTNLPKVGLLLARLTFKNGDPTPTAVTSAFTTVFNTTPITDHGSLAGLGDDDHTQYHTDARGDLRYAPLVHSHTTTDITDFAEGVDDRVSALLVAGSNITLTYNDVSNTLTIDSTGGGGGVTDHGALTGLGDDDHPQYHNDARGDARYLPINNPIYTGTLSGPGLSASATAVTASVPIVASGTTPDIRWYETDQVLPAGRWREVVASDVWKLSKNTAVAGDFSTESTLLQFSSTQCTMNVPLLMNNGSASAPSHSFSSDTGLGFWRNGAGSIGIAMSSGNFVGQFLASAVVSGVHFTDVINGDGCTLQASASSTALFHHRASGATILDLDAKPEDLTSASTIRINRQTTTTGTRRIDIHRGNGTSDLDHRISMGTAGTLVELCRNGGEATVNGSRVLTTADASTLSSGTWTPTLTNITNVAASTAFVGTWSRVGDTVSCAVGIDIDPTAASVATAVNISLPVASNLSTLRQLSGNGVRIVAGTLAPIVGGITGETTTDTARLTFINDADLSNRAWVVNFQYQVV